MADAESTCSSWKGLWMNEKRAKATTNSQDTKSFRNYGPNEMLALEHLYEKGCAL